MENIKSNIKKKLLAKLEKIRNKLKQEKDIYISKEHEEICEYFNKYHQLKLKIIAKYKSIKFESADDSINLANSNTKLLKFRKEGINKIPFKNKPIEVFLSYNQYNKKFINKFQKIIDIDYFKDFIKEQDKFIKSLSIREIYNIKAYTFNGDTIINSYINNTLDISKVDLDINARCIFFFQFLDYFTSNPIYKGANVPITNDIEFIAFIKNNYKKFDIAIYIHVINQYIKEMKAIFDKAPRNKKKFFVYRGVNDNYISNEVSQKKTRGYFTSNRFISTSLVFNVAVGFSKKDVRIVYEIAIEEGVPVIFIQGISYIKGEIEILLPINSTFYIEYALKKDTYYRDTNEICYTTAKKNINIVSLSYFDYI